MSFNRPTRRCFLAQSAAFAATFLAFGEDKRSADKHRIRDVRAWPVSLGDRYNAKTPKFTSDFDRARWRWRGPFAQLAGSVIVEIETAEGITGYGMAGGGGAAVYIIAHHLRDFLIGANPLAIELLVDQMYSSTAYYGRKGVPVMAISGVDLALWDIAGKHAGQPVHQLLGGTTKEKVPAYYTGYDMAGAAALGFRAFKIPIL